MAWIDTALEASGFDDAEISASRALTPALSMWSATLNIPLLVHQVEVTEVRTGNVQVRVTMPFPDAPVGSVSPKGVSEDLLWLAALYREALTSNSPLYRFLCLYKIIEAITVRRGTLKAGPAAKERVPTDPQQFGAWLHALFPVRPAQWDEDTLGAIFIPEARGRSVGYVRDNFLRPIRNDIGHLFGDERGLGGIASARLWVDDPAQVMRVLRWLPLTICIARLMMKNEFPETYLSFLDERGNARV